MLRPAPADLGCDSIGVDYRSVTFKIDPGTAEQVAALTDSGEQLVTYWAAGFRGGSTADLVVYDLAGQVVVADGDVLPIPLAEWPSLRGYFVCPTPTALYILMNGPS